MPNGPETDRVTAARGASASTKRAAARRAAVDGRDERRGGGPGVPQHRGARDRAGPAVERLGAVDHDERSRAPRQGPAQLGDGIVGIGQQRDADVRTHPGRAFGEQVPGDAQPAVGRCDAAGDREPQRAGRARDQRRSR